MKNTIIIIAIVIIILIAYFIISSRQTEAPLLESEMEISNDEEMILAVDSVEDGTYFVDTSTSKLNWTGRKKVLTNWIDTGTINIQSGSITIENGELGSNEFLIDMNSIKAESTGSGEGQDSLTTHLKSEDFFDVENNPTSKFVAKEIRMSAPNQFEVIGDLTIKNKSSEVIVPVTVYKEENQYKAVGSLEIDRTIWNVRFGSDKFFDNLGDNVIDDIITIDFELVASKNE